MITDAPENTPFLKQLVSSDKKSRDKAVDALRVYLTSGKTFTELELLKLWKGLFFCMWHSDRPLTQQRLSNTLASLLSPLPDALFTPFVSAFWKTITMNYSGIDSLRLDKFLYLIRRYINAAFVYLQVRGWPDEMLEGYLTIVRDVLCEQQGKVSDGLRYHILDTWIEELDQVDHDRLAPLHKVVAIVHDVVAKGRTKVLRKHAKGVLEDERLKDWTTGRQADDSEDHDDLDERYE